MRLCISKTIRRDFSFFVLEVLIDGSMNQANLHQRQRRRLPRKVGLLQMRTDRTSRLEKKLEEATAEIGIMMDLQTPLPSLLLPFWLRCHLRHLLSHLLHHMSRKCGKQRPKCSQQKE
jgi:hypothetical protein